MNTNEIRLYLGIIIPNAISTTLIFLIALINSQSLVLARGTIWLSLGLVITLAGLLSAYFWRDLKLQASDYLKFYLLNTFVTLFWVIILIL